jgi:sugar/nucleoside kinase (ribokinase family)
VPRLAVLGNLARDLVDGQPPRVGGGPYWAGRAVRMIDAPATIVTRCAERDREELVPQLRALGVPVRWQGGAATATFGISYEGETRHMRVEEVGDVWSANDLSGWAAEPLQQVPWVHVAPLFRSDFPAETLAALARGRSVLLDGQGLVRRPEIGALVEDAEYDPAVLRHVRVLKLSEDEAAVVLPEVSEAAVFALGVPEVLVTLGARGSIVFAEGRSEHVPTTPVDTPDPTGAGDAYSIGYVAARASGATPWAAARHGTTTAVAVLSRGSS